MTFRHRITVRFSDCDAAKIVYFPNYLDFCHEALEEFFGAAIGVPYARIVLGQGVGYPTVRLAAEYARPVPMGEILEMTVAVERVGGRSLSLRFEGRRTSDGVLAFTCRSTVVAMDMQTGKSTEMPPDHRRAFEAACEAPPALRRAGPVGAPPGGATQKPPEITR